LIKYLFHVDINNLSYLHLVAYNIELYIFYILSTELECYLNSALLECQDSITNTFIFFIALLQLIYKTQLVMKNHTWPLWHSRPKVCHKNQSLWSYCDLVFSGNFDVVTGVLFGIFEYSPIRVAPQFSTYSVCTPVTLTGFIGVQNLTSRYSCASVVSRGRYHVSLISLGNMAPTV